MNTVYESKYLKVAHHQTEQMFHYVFNEKTWNMTAEEYLLHLQDFIKIIRKYRPKRILGDMADFNFVIPPELQEWIDQHLFSVYAEIGFEKIAILLSTQYITNLSIQQTMEEDSTLAFKSEYFEDTEAAKEWLMAA
ncbi:hypothetical protein BKI52_06790 [marine bacterium AO1-C]|nr:hypothetical protein BKI52_06790 [marine bacterium AO1-C]